jgi:predicted transcriptional regulator
MLMLDKYSDNWRLPSKRAVLEMTSLSQSPHDRILWILANNGGKMERSRLRAATGMRYAMLIPILDKLVREGRIKMTLGKDGNMVSLISR